jgi:hypothetical protein
MLLVIGWFLVMVTPRFWKRQDEETGDPQPDHHPDPSSVQVLRGPGTTPAKAIAITTPVLVEGRALSLGCARCGRAVVLLQHEVVEHRGELLRVADLKCRSCGRRSVRYFRILDEALVHGNDGATVH